MPASVVMLSGGLDSTVNFQRSLDGGDVAVALTFDYGQRSARREREAAALMCRRSRVRHRVVRLPWLAEITTSALVSPGRALPHPPPRKLDDPAAARRSAERVWVPNRNGVFLAIAAAWAEALGAREVVAGFNAEEAATFPDNSEEFVREFNRGLRLSTRNRVRVRSYTLRRDKAGILRMGMRIGAPLDLVWCCYDGGRRLCGRCESCLRFLRAVEQTGQMEWFQRHHPRMPKVALRRRRRR